MLLGICATTLAPSTRAIAAAECSEPDGGGVQACEAGVEIGAIETVRQRCEHWCWAASIQTIFALDGRQVDQEAAVERVFGSQVCKTATAEEIVDSINGDWIDNTGSHFRARAQVLPQAALAVRVSNAPVSNLSLHREDALNSSAGSYQLVQELQNGRPLIVGALGHATVLTAAKYLFRLNVLATPSIELTEIVVRDPWPDSENRRVLTANETQDAFFVALVRVE